MIEKRWGHQKNKLKKHLNKGESEKKKYEWGKGKEKEYEGKRGRMKKEMMRMKELVEE